MNEKLVGIEVFESALDRWIPAFSVVNIGGKRVHLKREIEKLGEAVMTLPLSAQTKEILLKRLERSRRKRVAERELLDVAKKLEELSNSKWTTATGARESITHTLLMSV